MLDLKQMLIRKIQEISDVHVLSEVYRLLDMRFPEHEINELPEEQKPSIVNATKQITGREDLTHQKLKDEVATIFAPRTRKLKGILKVGQHFDYKKVLDQRYERY